MKYLSQFINNIIMIIFYHVSLYLILDFPFFVIILRITINGYYKSVLLRQN